MYLYISITRDCIHTYVFYLIKSVNAFFFSYHIHVDKLTQRKIYFSPTTIRTEGISEQLT